MAIDSLIKKLKEKSELECQKIIQDAEIQTANIKQNIISDAKKQAADLQNRAQEQAVKINTEGIRQIQCELNYLSLEKKNELLNKAYELSLQKLNLLDEKTKYEMYEHLIMNAYSEGNVVIKFNNSFANIYTSAENFDKTMGTSDNKSFIEHIETLINEKFNKNCVITAQPVPDECKDGGFYMCCSNYDVDFSHKSILDTIFDKNIMEISEILFATNEDSGNDA